MAKLDASQAACFVFTAKEGLLSPVAHDLQLRVSCFELEVAANGAISAQFDATSLRTVCAMKNGRPAHGVLSSKDMEDIDRAVAREVLEASRYPYVRFSCGPLERTGSELRFQGTLSLKDRQRTVQLLARKQNDLWVVESTLHQPDFGIKPYTAMLGTMRIKPDVVVRLEAPASLV